MPVFPRLFILKLCFSTCLTLSCFMIIHISNYLVKLIIIEFSFDFFVSNYYGSTIYLNKSSKFKHFKYFGLVFLTPPYLNSIEYLSPYSKYFPLSTSIFINKPPTQYDNYNTGFVFLDNLYINFTYKYHHFTSINQKRIYEIVFFINSSVLLLVFLLKFQRKL